MKHKILIADDSLTIQKVIKITLASEPFELFECTDANELDSQLDKFKPSIVLLDFNLSEAKTGYDLAREIKEKLPHSKVLMLFGTFDTVDESLLEESGANHKIVKPFDGTKFINLCRVMADEIDAEDAESINDVQEDFNTDDFPEPINEDQSNDPTPEKVEADDEDEWVVEGSQSFDEDEEYEDEEDEQPEVISTQEESKDDELKTEIKEWGMDIPGVIGANSQSTSSQIPGVIEAKEDNSNELQEERTNESEEDEINLPKDDDLAFPDESDLQYPGEIFDGAEEQTPAQLDEEVKDEKLPPSADLEYPDMGLDTSHIEVEKKSDGPKLRTLEVDDEDEPVVEDINVSEGGTDTDEAVNALKAELKDELEDKIEDSDDLWGADVVVEDEAHTEKPEEEEKEEEFHVTQEEDLPHVESHQLEKVVDNTSHEEHVDDFEFGDDSFEEVHDMSSPEDFPSDVMEEQKQEKINEDHPAAQQFNAPNIDTKDLEAQLKEKLTPVVEEFVKDYCRENIEKIAWEVIPDLAENLIKKEIQRISDSIIDPQ